MKFNHCKNIWRQRTSLYILKFLTKFSIAEGQRQQIYTNVEYNVFTRCVNTADFKYVKMELCP
jgi:hypothetical protein